MKIKEQTRKLAAGCSKHRLRLQIELMKSAQNTVLRLQIELTKQQPYHGKGEATRFEEIFKAKLTRFEEIFEV
ncbi:hypothetical protein [Streptococcus pneumoniae]|uniref:hypothetical protein n=1 Tax=Streptococcus pneumoniae TaxID=1313 RepID=UPI002150E430|nr:hypothetical protein [Streptococcus pneumoniae]